MCLNKRTVGEAEADQFSDFIDNLPDGALKTQMTLLFNVIVTDNSICLMALEAIPGVVTHEAPPEDTSGGAAPGIYPV